MLKGLGMSLVGDTNSDYWDLVLEIALAVVGIGLAGLAITWMLRRVVRGLIRCARRGRVSTQVRST